MMIEVDRCVTASVTSVPPALQSFVYFSVQCPHPHPHPIRRQTQSLVPVPVPGPGRASNVWRSLSLSHKAREI